MDAVDRIRRLVILRDRYMQAVQQARASSLVVKLVEYLFAQPVVTVAAVAEELKVTPVTAQQHINHLVAANILTETTGRKRNRIYVAKKIILTINEPVFGR